jgi:hypothetical protein
MSMTLWNIEQGLADLFERREELTVPEASGIESFVELQEVDLAIAEYINLAIAEYIKAEVAKVDGVRGWWKYLEMMRDAAKNEARIMQDRAQAFDRKLTVLKSALLVTLEEMEWRAGKPRKLEGKTGSISLVGNGGRQPVVITDESLIPDEYRTVTVKMNAELWRKVCAALPDLAGLQECKKDPNLTLIYNALESGMDGVPGAVLAPLGSHVRVK